jgi:membrane protease YdiL (CAAX protease family)
MSINGSNQHHPFVSLIYLLLLVLAGAVLFTALGFVIGVMVYGFNIIGQYQNVFNGTSTNGLGFIKIIQIASTVGMFIIPALVFARIERRDILAYLHLDRRVPWILILVTIAVVFSSGPVIEWMVAVNKKMVLPQFLHGLQEWMQNKETELDKLTKILLVMNSPLDLVVNLIMIAVLPALGEEFIFRGCFQNLFTRWTSNYHWGIWLAAILFSAMHAQFYGFIPRMVLGAMFGYLFVWGRSLWLPVLAHLINNGGAVIAAYVYQLRGQSLDKLDETEPVNWSVYLISALMTIVLLGYMHNKWKKDLSGNKIQKEKN